MGVEEAERGRLEAGGLELGEDGRGGNGVVEVGGGGVVEVGRSADGADGVLVGVVRPVAKSGDPSLVDAVRPDLGLEMLPGEVGAVSDAVSAPPFAAEIGLPNAFYLALRLSPAHLDELLRVPRTVFGFTPEVVEFAHAGRCLFWGFLDVLMMRLFSKHIFCKDIHNLSFHCCPEQS